MRMKLINLILIAFTVILISGCSYIQQFREAPLGETEEEPFISIIPEDEITQETQNEGEVTGDVVKEEIAELPEIVKEEVPEKAPAVIEEEKTAEKKPSTKLEVNEGSLVKLKLAATDPDGDILTYKFSEPLNEKGEWQTKKGDAGEYKVKIMVDDGKVSTEQEILIVIKALNKAPVLTLAKEITVNEGEIVTLKPEVSDPDGDQVKVTYSGWMDSAAYKTNYDDAGVYTVTVTASDSKAEVTQNVKVTVNDVNRAPVIESITLE